MLHWRAAFVSAAGPSLDTPPWGMMSGMTIMALAALSMLLQAPAPPSAGLLDEVRTISAAESNDARFDAVVALLEARNLPFTVEPFTIEKPVGREPRTAGRNIVVTLGESRGAGDMVIGAHYDAVRLPDGSLSRGAVDNAASSVLLVRIAESLRAEAMPIRVKVVWFDMEELGLIGSARYVTQHSSDRIVAMLNLDVNGYGDTILFGPAGRPENTELRRSLVQTCATQDLDCVSFTQMPPGDDRSFVKAGIPTVSLAILPALEAHQLWLMMHGGAASGLAPGAAPAIMQTLHTPADRLDKVDAGSMAKMLRFTVALVRLLSRGVIAG